MGRSQPSEIELDDDAQRIYERLGPLFEDERPRMACALASGPLFGPLAEFRLRLAEATHVVRLAQLAADAGYDSEPNHRYARNQLGIGLRRVHIVDPARLPRHGPGRDELLVLGCAAEPAGQAAPPPIFGPPYQPRPQSVPLHIPRNRVKVLVRGDGKRLEAAPGKRARSPSTGDARADAAYASTSASPRIATTRHPPAARRPGASGSASRRRPVAACACVRLLRSAHSRTTCSSRRRSSSSARSQASVRCKQKVLRRLAAIGPSQSIRIESKTTSVFPTPQAFHTTALGREAHPGNARRSGPSNPAGVSHMVRCVGVWLASLVCVTPTA